MSVYTITILGTTPIGGPIMGAVADATNARVPLVIGGAAALAAALFGLLVGRRVLPREAPYTPDVAEAQAEAETAVG